MSTEPAVSYVRRSSYPECTRTTRHRRLEDPGQLASPSQTRHVQCPPLSFVLSFPPDYQGVFARVVPRFGRLQCHGSVPTWPDEHRILYLNPRESQIKTQESNVFVVPLILPLL